MFHLFSSAQGVLYKSLHIFFSPHKKTLCERVIGPKSHENEKFDNYKTLSFLKMQLNSIWHIL